jgi:hypothetical protein
LSPLGAETKDNSNSADDSKDGILAEGKLAPKSKSTMQKKEKHARSNLDGLASAAQDLIESRRTNRDAQDSFNRDRLAFERERVAKQDNLAQATLDLKSQALKRKWDLEDRARTRDEEEVERRRVADERQSKQKFIFESIRMLEELASKPGLDENIKAKFVAQIGGLIEQLSAL